MPNQPRTVIVAFAVFTISLGLAALLAATNPALLGRARVDARRDGHAGAGARPGALDDAATNSAGPETEPLPPEPGGEITSPSGRVWRFGEADELGYVLPLDFRRARPARSAGSAQPRDELLRLRDEQHLRLFRDRRLRLFEEHRLGPDDGHTQNETSIDTDGDSVIAAFHRFGDASLILGVSRSIDGGHTWAETAIGDFHTTLTDPCVKSAGGGRWVLCYLASGGMGGSDYDVFTRVSNDGGQTWGSPVAVTSDTNFDDKPYAAARGSEILVGYADFAFSPAKVRAARSTNGGVSFDHDTILANNSVGGNGACPLIDPSGVYHVFWRDSFQDSLWVAHSTDLGATWSTDRGIVEMNPLPSTLPPGFRMVNLPSAAADPISGTIVVVWNDQRFGDADILSVRSTDGGHAWSSPIRVNDDAGTAAQFFPWIAVDPYGVFHACWYDRRDDGYKIDVYYARSTDGGTSWEPNVRVTAQAYTPVLPWDTGVAFIGDYNAIAANAVYAFPFYQDAREGNQDVYVALVPAGTPEAVDEPDAGNEADGGLAAGHGTVIAAPSAFSSRVQLRAAGRAGVPIDIFSAQGRRVREISLSGDGTTWWDGRDDSGAALPPGVYFARLRTGGAAARLVKLD